MITNFETITAKLTSKELIKMKSLIDYFSGKIFPVKQTQITRDTGIKPVTTRKLIHFIRQNGLLPIIGTEQGYFISYDREIIQSQINSLCERAEAILYAAEGLKKFTQK